MLNSFPNFIKFKFYDIMFYFSEKYSAKVVMVIKGFSQHCEIVDWIDINIKGEYHHVFSPSLQTDFFWFSRKHEAVLFKLVWGGE